MFRRISASFRMWLDVRSQLACIQRQLKYMEKHMATKKDVTDAIDSLKQDIADEIQAVTDKIQALQDQINQGGGAVTPADLDDIVIQLTSLKSTVEAETGTLKG